MSEAKAVAAALDRKPCGCLKTLECNHSHTTHCYNKNCACNPGECTKGLIDARTDILNQGFKGPEVEFDASKFLRDVHKVEATLIERGSRYGDFSDNAELSQKLEAMIRCAKGYTGMDFIHREALKFIFQKISRIVNGDPNYADNWHDIQGYAKLVEDRLPKEPK